MAKRQETLEETQRRENAGLPLPPNTDPADRPTADGREDPNRRVDIGGGISAPASAFDEQGNYIGPTDNTLNSGTSGQIVQGIKDTGQRIGEATGILPPEDKIDEDALYAPHDARVSTIYDKALAQAEAAGNFVGPQGPDALGPVERVTTQPITTSGVTAERIATPMPVTAATAGAVERYAAEGVAAPQDVVSDRILADEMGDAAQAASVRAGRATLDPQAQALRDEQLAGARAIGTAPSAAAKMFDAALAKTTREQLGIAAQARGAERGGARREAMLAVGQNSIEAADRAAAASAVEEQGKRVATAGALANVRGTDVDLAKTGAALEQEANNLDAQIEAAARSGNRDAVNALRTRQAELRQQARTDTAKLSLDAQSGNAARTLDAALATADARNAAAAAGAGAANTRGDLEAGRATDVAVGNADRDVTVGTSNAANALDASKFTAAASNTAAIQGAANKLTADTGNADRTLDRDVQQGQQTIAAGGNVLTAEQIRQQGTTAGLDTATDATRAGIGIVDSKIGAAAGQAEREQQSNERLVKTGTTMLLPGPSAPKPSDKRAKTDITPVSDDDVAELAREMQAVAFKYKPGVEDGGEHVGVVAQDLEKSKLGKKLVSQGAGGMKQVDYAGLAALMAAAASKTLRKHGGSHA